jgi:hypothetical protein
MAHLRECHELLEMVRPPPATFQHSVGASFQPILTSFSPQLKQSVDDNEEEEEFTEDDDLPGPESGASSDSEA